MITVRITLTDEEGKILADLSGDAYHNHQWKTPYDRPVHQEEVRVESDSLVVKDLYGWTFSPMVQRGLRRRS